MNHARATDVLKGQTSVAQKVYHAVPINTAWAAQAIEEELARTGHTIGLHTVRGCLAKLLESGLIRQHESGHYTRTKVKEKQPKAEVIPMSKPMPRPEVKPESKPEAAPVDRLLVIADRFKMLTDQFAQLSSELEEVAIGVSEQLSTSDADTKKLRQLQQILKSIT